MHEPYFAKKRTLSTWNTQGMEKSHYQARTRYFKHTRHGGGSNKENSLMEVFQWFYRIVWHRSKAQEKRKLYENSDIALALKTRIQRRKEAYNCSSASEKFLQWLGSRQRQGRRWGLQKECLTQVSSGVYKMRA